MDEAKKKALLEKMREIRKVGSRDDLQKAIDMYRKSGFGPQHSTQETADMGEEFLRGQKDSIRVPGTKEEITDVMKVKGKKPKLNLNKDKLMQKTGSEFAENLAKKRALHKLVGKAAKSGLKAIPVIGPLAAALASGDASAAIPVLGDAESLGPQKGSLGSIIEDPEATPEMRRKAIEDLKKGRR